MYVLKLRKLNNAHTALDWRSRTFVREYQSEKKNIFSIMTFLKNYAFYSKGLLKVQAVPPITHNTVHFLFFVLSGTSPVVLAGKTLPLTGISNSALNGNSSLVNCYQTVRYVSTYVETIVHVFSQPQTYLFKYATPFFSYFPYFESFLNLFFTKPQPITCVKKTELFISTPFIFLSAVDIDHDLTLAWVLINSSQFSTNSDLHFKIPSKAIAEQEFLKKIDKQFMRELYASIPAYEKFSYSSYELSNSVPFSKNWNLDEVIYKNLSWLDFSSIFVLDATYDLLASFYFEPFFFFWEKIQQSMTEFRLACLFREWAILFEGRVYNPKIISNDPTHSFPLFSHLAHPSENKPGLRILKRLYDYKANGHTAYYLDFNDLQAFALDKNFVYNWNYWIGVSNPLNVFGQENWTGQINFLWEKISSPKFHFNSISHRWDLGYSSYATRVMNFGFFPDFVMLWGQFNPNFDWLTAGYNWFFQFGETFMDKSLALDLVWYQTAENIWGGFEIFANDFTLYQSSYFPDSVATVWIPVTLIAAKSYTTPAEMSSQINEYNRVFMIKDFKTYKHLWADVMFSFAPLQRLALLRDSVPIDSRVFHLEKIINLYYGYNSSEFMMNYPKWFSNLTNPYEFFSTLIYNYDDDLQLEYREWKLVDLFWSHNYDYTSDTSIFFKTKNGDSFFQNFSRFINEIQFDDIGYINSGINRGDDHLWNTFFSWLNKNSLISFETVPTPHYSWWFNILNSTPFSWSIVFNFSTFSTLKDIINTFLDCFKITYVKFQTTVSVIEWNKLYLFDLYEPSLKIDLNCIPLVTNYTNYFGNLFHYGIFWVSNSCLTLLMDFFLKISTFGGFLTLNNFFLPLTQFFDLSLKQGYTICFPDFFLSDGKLMIYQFKFEHLKFSYQTFLTIFNNFEIYLTDGRSARCQIDSEKIVKFFYFCLDTDISPLTRSELIAFLEKIIYLGCVYYTNYILQDIYSFYFEEPLPEAFYGEFIEQLIEVLLLEFESEPFEDDFYFDIFDQIADVFDDTPDLSEYFERGIAVLPGTHAFLSNPPSYINNFVNLGPLHSLPNSKIVIFEINLSECSATTFTYLNKFNNFVKPGLNAIFNFFDPLLRFKKSHVAVQHFPHPQNLVPAVCIDYVLPKTLWLPVEFFIPLLNYYDQGLLVQKQLPMNELLEKISVSGLDNLNLWDIKQLEHFISYCMILDLQNKEYDTKQFSDAVNIINQLDYSTLKPKALEYDRYVNYIIKKWLYKNKA